MRLRGIIFEDGEPKTKIVVPPCRRASVVSSSFSRSRRTNRRRLQLSPLTGAALLLVLAGVALAVDAPVARLSQTVDFPGDLARAVHLSEIFAHGTGVALVLIAVVVLDPANRRRVARVATCAYTAGLMANAGKLLIARGRPDRFAAGSVFDSFQAWLPCLPHRMPEGWGHALQSFPSAHAATAVGLALGLTALYPHGRWLFFGFAALASCQRFITGAHFPSDVLAGGAVGCLAAAMMQPGTPLGRLFEYHEIPRKMTNDEIPNDEGMTKYE